MQTDATGSIMTNVTIEGVKVEAWAVHESIRYQSILIDPPWNERGGGKSKRGADRHYALTKDGDIAGLITEQPLWMPDRTGCSIWMWTTVSSLPVCLDVLKVLGARYVTHCIWVKGKCAPDGTVQLAAPGIGQRMRVAHEVLVYATIGKVPVPPPAKRLSSILVAPRPCIPGTRKPMHSAKPVQAYARMEAHDPPGIRRAELFARRTHPAWDASGDQLEAP